MASLRRSLTYTALLIASVRGLVVKKPLFGVRTRSISALFASPTFENRYFQLEEMEDRDTSETELFLEPSGSIKFGATDGPPPVDSTGTWEIKPDGSFIMEVTRTYPAGREKIFPTDMGEFEFKTIRTFDGEKTTVGDCLAVQGSVHAYDNQGADAKVGFFEMIDTTEEKIN